MEILREYKTTIADELKPTKKGKTTTIINKKRYLDGIFLKNGITTHICVTPLVFGLGYQKSFCPLLCELITN